MSDLHNRVDRINQVENATVISIHQNASPNTSFHGIQVFYGGDETLSRPLAQKVQETMIWALSPEKKRSVQRVDASVYLMNHIACRAILVECGFLSNPEEDRLAPGAGLPEKACHGAGLQLFDQRERTGRRILCMKAKTIFTAPSAATSSPSGRGQCPACGAWNTIVEQPAPAKGEGHRQTRPCTRRHPCAETGLRNDL